MDRSFIRMQMQAKIEEFRLYADKYISVLEDEKKTVKRHLDEEEQNEWEELIEQIRGFKSSADEIVSETDIIVARLTVLYNEYVARHNKGVQELQVKYTKISNGVSITRKPLLYSNFALSAGFNDEHMLMDLEFTGGKVYRYSNVPKELFENLTNKNSMKGLVQELKKYEFIIL